MAYLLGDDGNYLRGDDGVLLTDGMPGSDFQWQKTFIAQYSTSPVIYGLVESFNDAVDPSANIASWYAKVWNLDTAEGYGLGVWSRIVGVPTALRIDPEDYLGFCESDSYVPFGWGPFYQGFAADMTALTDHQLRRLVLAKAATNIGNTSARDANRILRKLLGTERLPTVTDIGDTAPVPVTDRVAYTVTAGPMMMMITCEFDLEPWELAAVRQTEVIPRPAGVSLWTLEYDPEIRFGFAEAGDHAMPFDCSTFCGDPIDALQ